MGGNVVAVVLMARDYARLWAARQPRQAASPGQ